MRGALNFLIAAKRAEISELEHLTLTGTLVKVIGRLIHELQRERGLTNVFLGSQATLFADARLSQIAVCKRVETQTRQAFDQWNVQDTLHHGQGARLFARIAWVLHALDELPSLRERIAALSLSPAQATGGFNQLIAGLLSVMFEAADSAADPELSRHLVAMFHFTQGKEFAGQERALASSLFASGHADQAHLQQWSRLIEAQERCFKVFMEFTTEAIHKVWHNSLPSGVQTRFDYLRRAGQHSPGELDHQLSQEWYQTATQRIDSMQSVEDTLAANLIKLCRQKISTARGELDELERQLQGKSAAALATQVLNQPGLSIPAPPTGSPPTLAGTTTLGPQLEHSILGIVQEQAHRLQTMSDELASVRATLSERKLVDRAKGLLMAHRKISEDEAYRLLRQTAMSQNRRLTEVAEAILAMSDLLPSQSSHTSPSASPSASADKPKSSTALKRPNKPRP